MSSKSVFRALAHKPRDLPMLRDKLEDLEDKCEDMETKLDDVEAKVRTVRSKIKRVKAKRRGITLDFSDDEDGGSEPETPRSRKAPAPSAPVDAGGAQPNYLKRPGHKADPRALEGVEAAEKAPLIIVRQLRTLETKLHNMKRKESDLDSQRKNMRITINMLRQEHLMRKEVFEGLMADLAASKRDMALAMEHSNDVYEEREKAIEYLVRAEEVAEQEEEQFQKEMATLSELLQREKEELEQIRDDVSRNRRHAKGRGSPSSHRSRRSGAGARGGVASAGGRMRKSARHIGHVSHVAKLAPGAIGSDIAEVAEEEEHEEVVYSYDELKAAFDKVKELSGIDDVAQLVETFIEREDQNFRAFNFIQRVNTDVERLQEECEKVEAAMKKYRETQGFQDVKRKQMLDALNDRLVTTLQRSKDFEERHERNEAAMIDLCDRVTVMFRNLRCDEMAGFHPPTPHPEDGRRRASIARHWLPTWRRRRRRGSRPRSWC